MSHHLPSALNALLDAECLRYFRIERAFLLLAFLSGLVFIVTSCWMLMHWRNWHWSI